MRDIIKTVEKVQDDYFMKNNLCGYCMTLAEVLTIMGMMERKEIESIYDGAMLAFRYGFVLGHRATVAGKIKDKL